MSSLSDLWADRKRKCEENETRRAAEEEAEIQHEKALLKAKNGAKKQAALSEPDHPQAVQARYTEDCKKQLEEESRHRKAILGRVEMDRSDRKYKEERERAARRHRHMADVNNITLNANTYTGGTRRLQSPDRDIIFHLRATTASSRIVMLPSQTRKIPLNQPVFSEIHPAPAFSEGANV